jgi:Holliday junction DNA helicase RuvA
MIASVSGRVVHRDVGRVVVEVGGVGLLINIPTSLSEQLHIGETISLFTQMVVRQDSISLYGFDTNEEREYFNLLLNVDGVGPRLALAMMSTLTPETIRRAVFNEQADVFSRVPGVGKKTAQKIMLYLQDRIKGEEGELSFSRLTETDSEVLTALTTLGYSVVEAQAALQSIPRDAPDDLETRLRLALQYFTK